MNHEPLEQAIFNNAIWCDIICRSHGQPGDFLEGIWINRHETPPFFPNALTLSAEVESAAQLAHIHDLVAVGLPGDWGVKDSFGALDLTPFGLQNVFSAEWIYRAAALPTPASNLPGVHWKRVTDAAELVNWEAAWRGRPAGEAEQRQAPIFLPALLANENIVIIAAYQDQQLIAGAIGSCTGEVVGISNVFVPAADSERFRAGCVAEVINAFPGRSLVGYEADQELADMQALGFATLGPLRIWVRVDESS